jgi:ribosome-binding protein aMBF1 (putative translation factor)
MAIQTLHQPAAGLAVKARRDALDWSREALGQRAEGVAGNTIRRIELGTVKPHPRTLAALDRALAAGERAARREAALYHPQTRQEAGVGLAPTSRQTDIQGVGDDRQV